MSSKQPNKAEKRWTTKAGYPAVVMFRENWLFDNYRCGYVGIPLSHPLAKRWCEELDEYVTVHGGVTYSDDYVPGAHKRKTRKWWVGFDCAHAGDTEEEWTLKRVEKECEELAKQLAGKVCGKS